MTEKEWFRETGAIGDPRKLLIQLSKMGPIGQEQLRRYVAAFDDRTYVDGKLDNSVQWKIEASTKGLIFTITYADKHARARHTSDAIQMLHCVVGNPYWTWKAIRDYKSRSTKREKRICYAVYQDENVRRMADQILAEKAMDELPYLADALVDAGLDEYDSLVLHLRDPAPHCPSCWALQEIVKYDLVGSPPNG